MFYVNIVTDEKITTVYQKGTYLGVNDKNTI